MLKKRTRNAWIKNIYYNIIIMSFVNPVAGFIPNSEFVYSTSTVNADDVNCTNLTATNANITNLVTTTFTPTNINGTNLSVVTASIGTATIGNADISNENVITSHITNAFINNETVGNINLNAMYINDLSIPENKSKIYRDGNITQFEGRGVAGTEASSFEFRAGNSGPPALLINNNNTVTIPTLDVVEFDVNEITANSIISTTSTLTTANITQLNVSTNASIQDLDVSSNIDTQSMTASGTINCSTLTASNYLNSTYLNSKYLEIKDITTGNIKNSLIYRESDILKFIGSQATPTIFRFYQYLGQDPLLTINSGGIQANISQNLASGDGISLSTQDGITTITNTKQVNDPLTINTLNSTTINNIGTITTDKLIGDIGDNLIGGTGIFISTLDGLTTITNTGSVTDPLNVDNLNVAVHAQIQDLDVTTNIGCNFIGASSGYIGTINGGDITATGNILGNISSNLVAGDGIELLTTTGITTINNTFALGSSTQYAFNAHGTSDTYQFISAGVILIYDLADFCVPVHTDYNKALRRYNVTTPGIYSFSYRALQQDYTSSFRIGIYKNAVLMGQSGSYSAESESLNVLIECLAGDYIDVRGVSGTGNVLMSKTASWFNGYLLQPKNDSISAGTNLSITSLLASGSINGNISGNLLAGTGIALSTNGAGKTTITNTGVVTDPLNVNTINSTTINSTTINNSGIITSSILNGNISNNLVAGENISLSTSLGGITTISGQAGGGGLATSTQYCFQVYGNQGDYVINGGEVVPNNLIQTCYPDLAHYNTSNYRYTVQVSGFYQMGFKIYFRNNAGTGPARFAIYRNEELLGLGGQDVGTTETFTLINYCNAGDYLTLRCFLGSLAIYQGLAHNWFYGYLLQPKNNTIEESTALTITSLNSTSSITSPTGNLTTLNTSNINNSININTDTLTATGLINGADIILSSTLEVGGQVISYQIRSDNLRIRSSDPVTYSDAIINKFNNTLNIAGGSGLDPGSVQFSTNGINYDMVYDGNLNLINNLNAGVVNAGFLNGNISNNLIAGQNISLSTSIGGITTISASGGSSTPNFFYASLLSNVNMGGTSFLLNPGNITSNCLNAGITYSGGIVGIQQDGYYRVSAQLNYYNGITLRASGELAALLNNIELGNYPKGYSYARSGEGRSAGAGFSDWIVFLNNGDNVRFLFTVALATSGVFNGSLSGFIKLPGSYISVTKM